jgi:hypothetical protein
MAVLVLGALGIVSCGSMGSGGGASGSGAMMGDLPSGGDPAEGGIAEVPNPSAQMASKSGKSLAALQRGHVVYMLKCGECHRYQLPEDLDVDEWEDTMPKMIKHAGLEVADEKAVLDYVIGVKKLRGQ